MNRPALGVSHYHTESNTQDYCGVLNARNLTGLDHVARDPHYKEIAETTVKEKLRRNSRVRAAEDDSERLLAFFRKLFEFRMASQSIGGAKPDSEVSTSPATACFDCLMPSIWARINESRSRGSVTPTGSVAITPDTRLL